MQRSGASSGPSSESHATETQNVACSTVASSTECSQTALNPEKPSPLCASRGGRKHNSKALGKRVADDKTRKPEPGGASGAKIVPIGSAPPGFHCKSSSGRLEPSTSMRCSRPPPCHGMAHGGTAAPSLMAPFVGRVSSQGCTAVYSKALGTADRYGHAVSDSYPSSVYGEASLALSAGGVFGPPVNTLGAYSIPGRRKRTEYKSFLLPASGSREHKTPPSCPLRTRGHNNLCPPLAASAGTL